MKFTLFKRISVCPQSQIKKMFCPRITLISRKKISENQAN